MTAVTLTVAKIEDYEGSGHCTLCGRENLRWICTLTDGTKVGTECAKKVLGWKPQPKNYQWIGDFRIAAEHVEYGTTFVMWQHKTGRETRETRDGGLTAVGGVRQDWTRRGWL